MEATYPNARSGLAMGAAAISLWSMSAVCIFYMGRQMGPWQFLAVAPAIGGLLQIACYLAMGRSLRALLLPPPKLWLAIALGFLIYAFLYTVALVTAATDAQAVGVSLMNFMWPALAVLFTTWLVPGARMHRRLALSLALSLAGVLLANGRDLAWPAAGVSVWPYVLGGLAAVLWAAYCALMSRWRDWARNYATAPVGFLLVSVMAAGICLWRGEWLPMSGRVWAGVLLTALGPWAGGYMLWELALHRAPGTLLGLLAAATPVLSTVCMMGMFALTGGGRSGQTSHTMLLVASVMIGIAVLLGGGEPRRRPAGAFQFRLPEQDAPATSQAKKQKL